MDTTFDPGQVPLLTPDLPGIGGSIKSRPEDFEVEEIPAYAPSGNGEFLYLWIEKRSMSAEYFNRQIARRLNIPVGEVGVAGLKDRHAVTRQMVSVPAHVEPQLAQLEGEGIRLLQVGKHTNKLRAGHLHGNRFRILIRPLIPPSGGEGGVRGDAPTNEVLAPLLERIRTHGLPNYYGPQRFGHDGETYQQGLALLNVAPATQIRMPRNPFQKKLALSAAQAGFFNYYLARRLQDGLLRQVLRGDVMNKLPAGGMFTAEDVPAEQARFDAREIVTAGPIFGKKTFAARDDAAAREAAVLETFGLNAASFAGFGKLVMGTRRHNLIYLGDLSADLENEGLRLSFTLPSGSYATVLLREIMKSAVAAEETED